VDEVPFAMLVVKTPDCAFQPGDTSILPDAGTTVAYGSREAFDREFGSLEDLRKQSDHAAFGGHTMSERWKKLVMNR
jgi:hypothetical protein